MRLFVINNRTDKETYDTPPKFLFMEVNKRCNLRCNHCDFWKRNDDDVHMYLTREQKKDILEDFASMNPNGKLVICGGEPMLDIDEYMFMASTARSLGLRVLSVVNGTRISTKSTAEDLVLHGPHEISVSFDDWREEQHDTLRGVKNAFKQAVRAIQLLVQARAKLGTDTKIIVMGLVHAGNYQTLDEFYDFVLNTLGADKLKLNFIQPSFGSSPLEKDTVFAELVQLDTDELVSTIHKCNAKYNLNLNPKYIDNVSMYFNSFNGMDALTTEDGWHSSKVKTTEAICNSYERNIMIDHYGFAKLCFATGFGGRPIVVKGDLIRFWNNANSIRAKMIGCKIPCGISHSVRKESATTPCAQ